MLFRSDGVREHFPQWDQLSWALVFRQRSEGHFLWRIVPLEAQVGRVGFQPLNILKPFGPRLNITSVVLQGCRAQLGVEFSYPAGMVLHGLFEGAPSRVDDLHCARNLFAAILHKSIKIDRKSTRLNSSH